MNIFNEFEKKIDDYLKNSIQYINTEFIDILTIPFHVLNWIFISVIWIIGNILILVCYIIIIVFAFVTGPIVLPIYIIIKKIKNDKIVEEWVKTKGELPKDLSRMINNYLYKSTSKNGKIVYIEII